MVEKNELIFAVGRVIFNLGLIAHTSTGSHVPKSGLTRKIRPGDGQNY